MPKELKLPAPEAEAPSPKTAAPSPLLQLHLARLQDDFQKGLQQLLALEAQERGYTPESARFDPQQGVWVLSD